MKIYFVTKYTSIWQLCLMEYTYIFFYFNITSRHSCWRYYTVLLNARGRKGMQKWLTYQKALSCNQSQHLFLFKQKQIIKRQFSYSFNCILSNNKNIGTRVTACSTLVLWLNVCLSLSRRNCIGQRAKVFQHFHSLALPNFRKAPITIAQSDHWHISNI